MTNIYRQGDVILEEVSSIPVHAKKVSDLLSLIGETGNAHEMKCGVFEAPRPKVDTDKTEFINPVQTWVNVGKGGALMIHPEHPVLKVPRGIYSVRRIRSYTYDKIREVTD